MLGYFAHRKKCGNCSWNPLVVDLLWDGAARAREVVAPAKPALTHHAYMKF